MSPKRHFNTLRPALGVIASVALFACSEAKLAVDQVSGAHEREKAADPAVNTGSSAPSKKSEPDASVMKHDAGSAQPAPTPASPPPKREPIVPGCTPKDELCNGKDDDCDGKTDNLEPVPCPGGGSRYCVAGELSACPTRCEECIPGSERTCFINYCTYWGVQTCSTDGRSWSRCREERAPNVCIEVAKSKQNSKELEQCCIDNDYCCIDEHDLDADGNRDEMLGRCDDVRCSL